MKVSSRTPEGFPGICPLCGKEIQLEYSAAAGDATCPHCGCLVWFSAAVLENFRRRVASSLGITAESIQPETPLAELGADSLDIVELVMELEEEFDLTIPDEIAENFRTVEDAIRFIEEERRKRE